MKSVARSLYPAELIIHDGLSQLQRALPAQKVGYFNVHEMDFATMLSMAVDYARMVTFYDVKNRPDGEWASYFAADETVVIASILATDLTHLGALFEQGLNEAGNDPLRFLGRKDLLSNPRRISSYALARMMEGWYAALGNTHSVQGVELRRLIESIIEGTASELEWFRRSLLGVGLPATAIGTIFANNFCNVWSYKAGDVSHHDRDGMSIFAMRSNFYSFAKAIEMIQRGARRLLQASMESKSHDPSVGMLIAFVKLFEGLQKRINRFTQKHLDFYYDRVLMMRPRGCVPDSAFLVIRPSVKGSEVPIARNTEFIAGVDENKRNIIYASDASLLVNDVVVSSLKTLFFNRDKLNFPENKFFLNFGRQQRQLASTCCIDSISANPDADMAERNKMAAMPLLGATKSALDIAAVPHARIGFAIASKILTMKEGLRSISVCLQFDSSAAPGAKTLEDQITKLTKILRQTREGEGGGAAKETDAETFFRVFQDMFSLSLTTASGWLAVPEYLPSYSGIEPSTKTNSLILKFSLPLDFPAVERYVPALHGEDYHTDLPVLRCVTNPNTYIYAYDFLKNFAVRDIRIDVDVRGCRDLLIYNQVGQLAPLAPFTPFGPIPAIGSYLIIGSAEIAIKQLSSFDVDIEWGGLPGDLGGFKAYYRGYGDSIETVDFQANVSVLVNGKWIPSDTRANDINSAVAPVALFESESSEDDSVSHQANLSCDEVIHYYKPLDGLKKDVSFAYTTSSRGGFFKFTLAAPAFAFGHQAYPGILARTLTANSRQKNPQLFEVPPNVPYTPSITSIEAHYSAFSSITPSRVTMAGELRTSDQFIQLHPMGWESMNGTDYRAVFLLPQYENSGNLFIGLDGSRIDGMLTLFFHLREDSLPMDGLSGKGLQWFYLRANRWVALTEKQIVSDSTEGFMTSGIVTLDLPADIGKSNSVMPGDLFWLKLSGDYELEKYCSVYSVYAQAVKVSWREDLEVPSRMPTRLPAGTISRSRKTIPGVARIIQVKHSFGGKPQETRDHAKVRISERLRHKNRALTATDYEMLILEKFPEIYRVKCFANMAADPDPAKRIRPGHILIVAVPYLSLEGHLNQMPMLSGHLVNEVKEFVMDLAPQFATIRVKNPVYEQIQVRCTVKLKKGLRGGHYSNLLNQAISDFLSPWKTPGYTTHFGWCIRQHDLESYIQDRDYIDNVTNFSMLRIAPDGDDNYDLLDTASNAGGHDRMRTITPKYPWSIAIPLKHHAIDTTDDFKPTAPTVSGVDELEIGTTFIVSSGN